MSGIHSFFDEIKNNFGEATHSSVKQVTRLNEKLIRLQNRRKFLTQCRTAGVFPRHVQLHIPCLQQVYDGNPQFHRHADKIANRFKRSILSLEIRITHHTIREHERRLQYNTNILKERLPSITFNRYMELEKQKLQNINRKIKRSNIKKLQNLKHQRYFGHQDEVQGQKDRAVVNLTNITIPEGVTNLLGLGPKFAINPPQTHRQTFVDIITDTEYVLSDIFKDSEDERNEKRQMTNNILTNFRNKPHNTDNSTTQLHGEYNKTRRWLKEHPEVIVTFADKGNKTVFIDRNEYDTKMKDILGNVDIYQTVTRDPTKIITSKHNQLIKNIVEEGGMDQFVGKTLITRNGTLGRIYGQVKIHKQDRPLRPIISTIGMTIYNTAKYLADIMRNMIGNGPYDTKDSFQLASRLKNVLLPPNYVMVSFDVVSMFTNIPKDLVLEIVSECFEEIRQHTTLNETQLIQLITFIFDNCFFMYNDNIYKQNSGLPMGSSLSPALADLVLNKLLSVVMEDLPAVEFVTRYVDDLLLMVPADDVDMILQKFNSFHSNIQFTMEPERDRVINFLELSICRRLDGRLDIAWYRKPTASLRYMNFYSNHTITQKRNIVTMLNKRLQAFTDQTNMISQRNEVRRILIMNDYPSSFIDRYLSMTVEHRGTSPTPTMSQQQSTDVEQTGTLVPAKKYYKMPFVRDVSHKIRRVLKTENTEISFYHTYTVGRLYTNTKTSIPMNRQSNLVYSIPCSCGARYIGQTKQYLGDRVQQHRASLNRLATGRLTQGQQSGITQHISSNPDHQMHFDQVMIVDKEDNYKKRLIKEAIHISKTENRLNLQTDIQDSPVSLVYSGVIHRLC